MGLVLLITHTMKSFPLTRFMPKQTECLIKFNLDLHLRSIDLLI